MKIKVIIPLLAGMALLCACGGSKFSKTADTTSLQSGDNTKTSSAKSDTLQPGPKLVKTADMRFKVKNVQQTGDRITALATSFNGTVVHHFINSVTSDSTNIRKSDDSLLRITVLNTTAEMTVKIPPANMENFMGQVAKMGIYINKSRMDITDKSLDYLATKLKLKNQSELVARQKNESDGAKKSPDELLAFKNGMVDQQIGNRRTDDSVKNSVVTLSFYESSIVSRELIANVDLSDYNPPFFTRLGMSVGNGWRVFLGVIVELANLWILLPLGFGGWLIVKYYKRKKPVDLAKS